MKQLIVFLLAVTTSAYNFEDCPVKPLTLSEGYRIGEKSYSYSLDYFHHKGLPYAPIYTFTDVFLNINLTDPDSYQFYQGQNCTEVKQAYENDNRYFGLLKKAAMLRSHHISPFNDTIVGVSTTQAYQISVQIWKINYIRLVAYLGAILLFLLAGSLVRNVVFYYTSGCSFGILASLLLVAFIVWRVAPKKTIGIPVLIGGWSVSLYMLNFAWNNLQSILVEYQKYVIGYFSTVLLVSLAVCYKKGPPTDERSHDIAQWTLQLVALVIIYFSSQVFEVSAGTMLVLIIQELSRGYLFAGVRWYFAGLRAFWKRMFPNPRKFLSEEEYDEEGKRITQEELNNLKNYCKKSENRPWKLAGNVRNSRRLARFVEGESEHVTEDEINEHDMTAEFLERIDYDDENDYGYYNNDRNSTYREGSYAQQDDDDEWDEVVVKRRPRGFQGPSSVQSVRVPRSVASRLLTPYQSMNHTFNGGSGSNYGFERRSSDRERDDFGRNRLGSRDIRNGSSMSPAREAGGADRRIFNAYTDVRPQRPSQNQRPMRKFDAQELERLRAEMLVRKEQNLEEEERRIRDRNPGSSSSSSVISSFSSRPRQRKSPRTTPRRSTRRQEVVGSESDDDGEI